MEPVSYVLTEQEILAYYWDYWVDQMLKAGKEDLISEQNCIEDYVVVNWGERVSE